MSDFSSRAFSASSWNEHSGGVSLVRSSLRGFSSFGGQLGAGNIFILPLFLVSGFAGCITNSTVIFS